MRRSQNAGFKGAPLGETPLDSPIGEETARVLAARLGQHGWTTAEVELWRDRGWSFTCVRGTEQLELVLVATLRDEWMAQLAPSFTPGWFGRVFRGKRPSASPEAMHALAVETQAALSALGFTDFRWSWDTPPGPTAPNVPSPPAD